MSAQLKPNAYNVPPTPFGGRGAWTADDLIQNQDWSHTLDADERAEILAAYETVKGRDFLSIKKGDFPIPKTAAKLAVIREELEGGRGLSLLKGLPIDGLSDEEIKVMWWGVGTNFAPAVAQNRDGDKIWEVRDEASGSNKVHGQKDDGAPLSSRARASSNGPLRFHTDGADALALLCVRTASAGGDSKIASSIKVHDEILKRRPDLHALLCQDYHRTYESSEERDSWDYYSMPIFTRTGDHFSSQYSRTYVEEAQHAGAPQMTPEHDEALDLLAEVAEETHHTFRLERGDMFFFNNHACYHGRAPFQDNAANDQDRLLLRIWFAPENSRPLPECYRELWGTVEPGKLRGGRGALAREECARANGLSLNGT